MLNHCVTDKHSSNMVHKVTRLSTRALVSYFTVLTSSVLLEVQVVICRYSIIFFTFTRANKSLLDGKH